MGNGLRKGLGNSSGRGLEDGLCKGSWNHLGIGSRNGLVNGLQNNSGIGLGLVWEMVWDWFRE